MAGMSGAEKSLSSAQFEAVRPPKSHGREDNFNGERSSRAPEREGPVYRQPAGAEDKPLGAAWQPSANGVGRPVTPFSSGYYKPIVT